MRAEVPSGLPLPLWAGDPDLSYADLLATGSPSSKHVVDQPDGRGKQLTWQQNWDKAIGTFTVTVTLGEDLLPARIDIAGRGELAGTNVERTTSIEYRFETGASFADSDLSTELPQHAVLTTWMYEYPLSDPLSDKAEWGQYWLGTAMGDWSIKTAQLEVRSSGRDMVAPEEFISLTYRRPGAGSPTEALEMRVMALDAQMSIDARQLGEQQVDLAGWTKRETTLAGKQATVYMGPVEGGGDVVDSICIFLPDAFIAIELWDLADPETVLDAVMPVAPASGGTTPRPQSRRPRGLPTSWPCTRPSMKARLIGRWPSS